MFSLLCLTILYLFNRENPQWLLCVDDAMTIACWPLPSNCLCVNIYLCLSPPCSLQHCLNRTSPCMWQCLYPILMPCTSLERLLEARSWRQPQPPSVTIGCCPLHRLLSIGIWPQVEVLRDPPVKAMQVSASKTKKVVYCGQLWEGFIKALLCCVYMCWRHRSNSYSEQL